MRKKRAVTVRLTPEAIRLINELSEKLGVTQAAVIELALRLLAEREKLQ